MGEIVNLRRARKAKRRASDEAQAAANRIKFGRTKADRLADTAAAERLDRQLDGARRDD